MVGARGFAPQGGVWEVRQIPEWNLPATLAVCVSSLVGIMVGARGFAPQGGVQEVRQIPEWNLPATLAVCVSSLVGIMVGARGFAPQGGVWEVRQIPEWSLPATLAVSARCLMEIMVGARGFEPPTTRSRTVCATRLRYAPSVWIVLPFRLHVKTTGDIKNRSGDIVRQRAGKKGHSTGNILGFPETFE